MARAEEAYQNAGIKRPHEFQIGAWKSIIEGHNAVIAAGTGRGKTEAAFLPAAESGKRVIVLYPTKALLQDQQRRVSRLTKGKTIAVDTGDEDDRCFYHADVILSSLDKFLYRLFGYGKKRWSYLYPYRIGFETLRGTLLILDEAHAYEEVAFSHFWFILKKLTYERRVQTVLLSATLPPSLVEALEDRDFKYFPRVQDEGAFFDRVVDNHAVSPTLIYSGQIQADEVVPRALEFFSQGKRVIVVLDRVVKSTTLSLHAAWEALASRCGERPMPDLAVVTGDRVSGNALTYHGHQMPSYRARVLDRLQELDLGWKIRQGDSRRSAEPFILVTTSALEVGVDISSDVLITDLCEPDSFVQRVGRCARRAGESGEVYLVAREEGRIPSRSRLLWDFLSNLSAGSPLDNGVRRQLSDLNSAPDLARIPFRLEYVQDQSLYRYVYDFVEENRELWEKGIVITRDWEPAVPLVLSENRNGESFIGGIAARDFWRCKEIKEKLLLPLSSASDLAPHCAWVVEGYNEGNQYAQRVAVGGAKDRTLSEALRFAGLRPQGQGKGGNKLKRIYALDVPLILILGESPPTGATSAPESKRDTWPYRGPNLGVEYYSRYAGLNESKRFPSAPSPKLAVEGVILRKGRSEDKGELWKYELPLYWFAPRREEHEP